MKLPYTHIPALSIEDRHAQMFHALQQGFPKFARVPIDESKTLSIACYGPSLADTWQALRPPIVGMSGTTRFLADRGVVVDYHVDMDPRSHKVQHIDPPIDGVHYLMASVCPPRTWKLLQGQRVTLWHTYSGKNEKGLSTYDWAKRHDPGSEVFRGGSTIGLTSVHLGMALGFRHFEIHGMDGSFVDETRGSRHAGPHYGHRQGVKPGDQITWDAEGTRYYTSRIMANAVTETLSLIKSWPVFCVFHGSGLTQALVREANLPNACTADQVEKATAIRRRTTLLGTHFWETLIAGTDAPSWLADILRIARDAETRRGKAKYNTGTVPVETAMLLRSLCRTYRPKLAVEVGTFIGTSTLALEADHLYTCDRDNDCLPSAERRTCFPYKTATDMFVNVLAERGERSIDFFFFDGRLQDVDVPLVARLAHERTVYALDDFSDKPGANKGKANAAKLRPILPHHVLVEPYPAFAGRSTLAALVPEAQ